MNTLLELKCEYCGGIDDLNCVWIDGIAHVHCWDCHYFKYRDASFYSAEMVYPIEYSDKEDGYVNPQDLFKRYSERRNRGKTR